MPGLKVASRAESSSFELVKATSLVAALGALRVLHPVDFARCVPAEDSSNTDKVTAALLEQLQRYGWWCRGPSKGELPDGVVPLGKRKGKAQACVYTHPMVAA